VVVSLTEFGRGKLADCSPASSYKHSSNLTALSRQVFMAVSDIASPLQPRKMNDNRVAIV